MFFDFFSSLRLCRLLLEWDFPNREEYSRSLFSLYLPSFNYFSYSLSPVGRRTLILLGLKRRRRDTALEPWGNVFYAKEKPHEEYKERGESMRRNLPSLPCFAIFS